MATDSRKDGPRRFGRVPMAVKLPSHFGDAAPIVPACPSGRPVATRRHALARRCVLALSPPVSEGRTDRPPGPELFPGFRGGRRGTRLSRAAIGKVLRKVVAKAGITKRISPHSLRHNAESLIVPS